MKIEVFADVGGGWRWHFVSRNGKLVCTSGEAFDSKGNAMRAARSFARRLIALVPIKVVE